ncbi:10681_t:CDS:1, partial [Gigaspora rosea]
QSRRECLQIFLQTEEIANYDRIERLISTYAIRLRVKLLANESALAQSLNNLNQTLLEIEYNQIMLLQTRKIDTIIY